MARKFSAIMVAVAALMVLAAWQPTPAQAAAKPKIVVWLATTYTTEADAFSDKLITDWCAKNNVDVELNRMAGDVRVPKWKTAYESKQFPDIGCFLEMNDAAKFMLSGVLLETTAMINKMNKLEGGYTEGALRDSRDANGKYWMVPFYSGTNIFYVRKDKLQEKGLALPKTWDDVLTISKAITVPGKFWGWGAQVGTPSWDSEGEFSAMLWAYGGKTWDEQGKPAIDSAETRQVLDLYKAAWKAGVIPPDATTWDDSGNNKAYQTGFAGMIINTPSVLAYMEKNDPELLAGSEITLVPQGPKGRFAYSYFYRAGIFNTTKYPKECLALIEYLMNPAQLRPVYDLSAGNMMPIFKNMINDPMWKKSPQREMVTKMVEFTVPQGYPGSTTPWIQDAWMDHTVAKMFNRVLVNNWANDKAIAECKATLQGWYDNWHK
jgi:multiple sugar transport system substrate-binding protein